jgi:NADPH2:quinone reductase
MVARQFEKSAPAGFAQATPIPSTVRLSLAQFHRNRGKKVRAAYYESIGPASDVIRVGERPLPDPGPREVRIRIHVSGVNPSDVKARAGARGALAYPYVIPHSDGAGIIDAVGSDVSPTRVGERVWTWNGAWRRPFGTCGEFVCLPSRQAVSLPSNTNFDAGACLGIPAMTACHAALGDGPLTGQTVLVTGGAGAVGHYAIQFAKWSGARVIATVSGMAKSQHAKSAGADHVINYREQDVVTVIKELTAGAGVDRIVEVEFGGNLAVSNQVLKTGGVIAAYGSMAVPTPQLPFFPMMFNHTTVHLLLVYALNDKQRQYACGLINDALKAGILVSHIGARFALDETAQAHIAVEAGSVIGNVVVAVN